MYKELGVMSVATESEIKSAYKQRALEYHPDKWMDKPLEDRAKAEKKFKEIGNYLEILTDPFKRQLYDEGYDAVAIEERVKAAQRAAHENPDRRHHH
jgi:DnaJ-class molecular chaperone